MMETKKTIYAAHNIEYIKGKIYAPLFGWINPLLINGNAKLGRGVWTWSTLAGTGSETIRDGAGNEITVAATCCCNCAGCYAQNGCYRFPSTRASLARKTALARIYADFMVNAIIAQIKADKIRFCRIHAAGDFFSMEYINAWRRIATACPDCVFWTYTKNIYAERAFDDLENVNVVRSLIPGYGYNFGRAEYVKTVYDALIGAGKSTYICRCGVDKNQHCSNCKGCSKNEYVLFLEHGTGYDAGADPLFPALAELINSQARPE